MAERLRPARGGGRRAHAGRTRRVRPSHRRCPCHENAVIPYAVGVDIACRMKMTVFDRKASTLAGEKDRLANIIEAETRFGVGCEFKQRREHEVMDEDWDVSPITKRFRDKAAAQLGTSGSGNHFVEFGAFADSGRPRTSASSPANTLLCSPTADPVEPVRRCASITAASP